MSSHKWESFVNYQVYCHPHLFLELARLMPRVLWPLRLPPLTLLETHRPGWVKFPSLRAWDLEEDTPKSLPHCSRVNGCCLQGPRGVSYSPGVCLLRHPLLRFTLNRQIHYFLTGFSAFSLCAEQHVLDHYPALARSSLLTSVNAHINSIGRLATPRLIYTAGLPGHRPGLTFSVP